jgi:hypothetical protein
MHAAACAIVALAGTLVGQSRRLPMRAQFLRRSPIRTTQDNEDSIMKPAVRLLVLSMLAAGSAPAVLAHHSAAAFDTSKEVTVTGTVTQYSFRNPHVYMTLDVKQDDGSVVEMEVEAGAGSVISPLGFNRDSVKIGEVVNVVGNPGRRQPDALMLGKELYKQDGTYFPLHINSRSIYEESAETATGVAGTWFPPRASFFGILGSIGQWNVTEKGKAAIAAASGAATPQKDCMPLGEPALMFYPVASTITVYDDRVEMKIDWLDSERTVWLDGREHPPASETFQHGHSIGHFEGSVLVVDSANFSYNPIGLSTTLPSGTGKHLEERYEVSADGKTLVYSGRVEDPEYLVEPAEWSFNWLYRPAMQHSNERCDIETAQKFLDD